MLCAASARCHAPAAKSRSPGRASEPDSTRPDAAAEARQVMAPLWKPWPCIVVVHSPVLGFHTCAKGGALSATRRRAATEGSP